MVPRDLRFANSVTSSETRVFAMLKDAAIPGTAFHSLNLPEHDYKLTGEIDFALVTDRIMLVVEVKGASVALRDGVWTYSDRSGRSRTSNEGPFMQAQSAMFALRRRLSAQVGRTVIDRLTFGHLIVTTDVDLPSGFEWDDETCAGRTDLHRLGFAGVVERVTRYWIAKQRGRQPIDAPTRRAVENALRSDFDRAPGLAADAESLDTSYERLTDEQFDRLDVLLENERVLCAGGAGTGKTFLAAEVARRSATEDDGRRVLLVCRSRPLAAFLERRLTRPNVVVRSFDALSPDIEPADHLIVDEAQDLMTFDHLDVLDGVVRGGLSGGRWAMFVDLNRQAHVHGGFDQVALEMVLDTRPTRGILRMNCRNTREIAFQTRLLTGADIGDASAGSGPKVTMVDVADRTEETALLQSHIQQLRDQNVTPGSVTLVSVRGDWDTSAAAGLRETRRGRLRRIDAAWSASWPGSDISWASAVDVKGLENRFVCVIDVDGLDSDEEIDRFYVALTRPRAGLWIAVPNGLRPRIDDLARTYAAEAATVFSKDR